jgi:uncharacterized membrane protein YbhN (UPF0104 family)
LTSRSGPIAMARSFARRLARIPTPVIFLASVLIAVALLWQQGAISDLGPTIRSANRWQILGGLLLYLAGMVLLCVRWHVLAQMIGGHSRLLPASEAFVTSVAINYAAPLSLAIPSRALLTKRALGLTTAQTAGLSLWEVAIDLVVLAGATGAWIVFGGWRADRLQVETWQALLGIAVLVVGFLATIAAFRIARKRTRYGALLAGRVGEGLAYPRNNPRLALAALVLTVVFWIAQGFVLAILLSAIEGHRPRTLLVLGLVSMPILVGMISPVPGGAGIRESLMLVVASVHGANEASVLLAGVTYRIALFAALPVLYIAIQALWRMRPGDRGTMSGDTATGTLSSGGDRDNS